MIKIQTPVMLGSKLSIQLSIKLFFRFFFDGEELNEDETGEDLDLEGDECIDVHPAS